MIPVQALERRADIVGIRNVMQPEAGYALGQCLLIGLISRSQHDAGIAFRQAWHRWASLAGLPPHEVTQRAGRLAPDVDPETWEKARDKFRKASAALRAVHPPGLVWAAVESIVMDDVLPPLLSQRGTAVCALQSGLTALVGHFGLPVDTKPLQKS